MDHLTTEHSLPYPQNLLCAIFGKEFQKEELPPDLDDSIEYLLETQMPERDAFILILRYLRGMRIWEIAAYYGLSDQRISQIIHKSLRRLRQPSCCRYLQFGCAAIQRQEERQAGERRQHTQGPPQDSYPASPLCGIPDARERIDTMLLRGGLHRIEWLGLSTRAYNCIAHDRIQYVWQLCLLMPGDVLRLRNAGKSTLSEIQRNLLTHGLDLDDGTLGAGSELRNYTEQRHTALAAGVGLAE